MYRRGCCLHISSEMDCVEITDRHEVGVIVISDSDEDGQGSCCDSFNSASPASKRPRNESG